MPIKTPPSSPPLSDGLVPIVPGHGLASDYAKLLLGSLGWPVRPDVGPKDPPPDVAWARSGAMALTGRADGPARLSEAPVAACAAGAGRAFEALADATPAIPTPSLGLDGAALLGERAATSNPPLRRDGVRAPGGSCRLIRCADGWLALNLARADDEALLPAWLETPLDADPWIVVEQSCANRCRDELIARGRLMGLAVSPLPPRPDPPRHWQRTTRLGPGRARPDRPPLVVDLSSLWAGPLCGQLLASRGARVIKVESLERPDGARAGDRAFFDLMNGEKESVALAFREPAGRRALLALIEAADIVIEASRPRALAQLGIAAEEIVARSGTTWLSITGHGRRPPASDWVALGDDAAVAGGLVVIEPDGTPGFCGDAIADPLTGVHAALAALSAWAVGGGRLVELSLSEVAGWVRGVARPDFRDESKEKEKKKENLAAQPPRMRPPLRAAAPLGADTQRILAEVAPMRHPL